MLRYDYYSRDEKHFSAMVLPYLFMYENFLGLKSFLKLINTKMIDRADLVKKQKLIPLDQFSKKTDTIQIVPELHIERDLSKKKIDIPPDCFKNKRSNAQSVPDLLIIYSEWAILIEVKFFTSFSGISVYDQMIKQQYILDIIKSLSNGKIENTIQIAITPLDINIRDYILIQWEEIYNQLKPVVQNNDYVLTCLKNVIEGYSNY